MGELSPSPSTSARGNGRHAQLRERSRSMLVRAARLRLSEGAVLPAAALRELDLDRPVVRALFPTDADLLDAVNDELVSECIDRLRLAIERFAPVGEHDLVRAAAALAGSRPLDRTGLIVRATRRLAALPVPGRDPGALAAERRFSREAAELFERLMARLGRRLTWSRELAAKVILDTYERAFEAWLLGGHDESRFGESRYITQTLPEVLERLSEPTDGGLRARRADGAAPLGDPR